VLQRPTPCPISLATDAPTEEGTEASGGEVTDGRRRGQSKGTEEGTEAQAYHRLLVRRRRCHGLQSEIGLPSSRDCEIGSRDGEWKGYGKEIRSRAVGATTSH
jgi:hypothetical protein